MAFFESIFGTKPKVPVFKKLEPTDIQKQTVAGNLEVLPSSEKLGAEVNRISQQQLESLYGQALPFYNQIKEQVGENILRDVSGDPSRYMDELQRATAAQAVYGGFGGTARQANLTGGRAFEMILNQQARGVDAAGRWLSFASVRPFDVTSMFLSPLQRYGIESSERELAWNAQYLQNQINAMPGPVARGLFDFGMNAIASAANFWGANMATDSSANLGSAARVGAGQSGTTMGTSNSGWAGNLIKMGIGGGGGGGMTAGMGSGAYDLGVSGAIGGPGASSMGSFF